MRRAGAGVIGAMLGAVLLAGGTPASAETTECTGAIGAVSLDNVVVPDGQLCSLNGTRLEGNIVVLTGAVLSAGGVRVNGNIQAEGAEAVFVNPGSTVGGSIQIVQGSQARIDRVRVDGDLQLFENRGSLRASGNSIGGNLQVDGNTGGVVLLFNVVEGALQCKQNTPAPTGGGNEAGDAEGQCADLEGPPTGRFSTPGARSDRSPGLEGSGAGR
jgi:hypothetical protein